MYIYLLAYVLLIFVAPFEIGFEQEIYIVREGETVDVCVQLFAPPELQDAIFSDVYIFIEPKIQRLPSAGKIYVTLILYAQISCESKKLYNNTLQSKV